MTDSIAQSNAAQSAFYAEVAARNNGDPRPDAMPEWDDVTERDHDDHRAECEDACDWCDGHRAWGGCTACERWPVETNDSGETFCCFAPPSKVSPELDDLREWWAA